ncbi:MAG: helix-turn-helix domain-containing protein [Myxococcota bacterium]
MVPIERTVHFLVLPGVHLLDLSGAAQVFYEASRLGGAYRVRFVGERPEVESAQELCLSRIEPLSPVQPEDQILVAGIDSSTLETLPASIPTDWLTSAVGAGARVGTICTGAFVLGWAGLLSGRRCTTHWRLQAELSKRFPDAEVLTDRLFVRDQRLISSAGVTSGIDMALSIVEQDHGPLVAARVAREIVVYVRRDGSSPQYSVYLDYRTHLHPGIHRVQDWIVQNPAENPTLEDLGRIAGMSPRNLTRSFRAATGITLKTFATRLKLEVARNLMNDPGLNLEGIAARCGYSDARQLRRIWSRSFGESPTEWKQRTRRTQ